MRGVTPIVTNTDMLELEYKKFIERFFTIVDKNEKRVPFILNSVQSKVIDSLTGRDIILKARQEGMSSLILALFTVDFLLMENSRSVCIAHNKDATIKLFDRVKFYLRSFEDISGEKVPIQYNTRSEVVNEANNSVFYIGTAGSSSFGRSATLTNVHFSEFAFYPEPEQVFTSAGQAGTPRRIILETTANGMGTFFYKLWNDAKEGKSNYAPHFFSWADFPDYAAPSNVMIEMTTEEKKLKELHGLTMQQLAWRRLKMSEFVSEYMFKQEYPLFPEEAFISSGNPVFNVEALSFYKGLRGMIKPPKFIGNLTGFKPPFLEENPGGYIKVWEKPKPNRQYVIGADPCEGIKGGDYACAQVIDRQSFDQVAVWHGHIDADQFGRELFKLGTWYNNAMIAPERNSIGIATVITLRDLYYANLWTRERVGGYADTLTKDLGWQTDSKTRPLIIGNSARALRDKLLGLHDEATLMELFSFQYDESGRAGGVPGSHDDRVMALMIAIEMYNRVPLESASNNAIAQPDRPTSTGESVRNTDDFYNEGPGGQI